MKNPSFTVANCVLMKWENPIFARMGLYADASRHYYEHFIPYARKHNISIIRTDFRWYDKKKKVFTKAWVQDPLMGWIRANDIKVDIVHDLCKHKKSLMPIKKYFARKKMYAANPFNLDLLLADKLKSYRLLKDLYPLTFEAKDRNTIEKALNKIPSEKVVIKPKEGSSAKNVFILTKEEALKFDLFKNALVQEFIESQKPVQDYRVVYANGKVLHYYTRVAKKGSYYSNFSRGAKMHILKQSQIPKAVLQNWQIIEKEFSKYPYSMLTADFMIDTNEKAWLIETNTKPGKVIYAPNNEMQAFNQMMKATVENYTLVYRGKIGA